MKLDLTEIQNQYIAICEEIHILHESLQALNKKYIDLQLKYNSKLGYEMRGKMYEIRYKIKKLNITRNKLFYKLWGKT